MLLLFTVPDMNSPGVGVYASLTMRVNIAGDVLSTQSAAPSDLPGVTWQASDVTFTVQRSFLPSAK